MKKFLLFFILIFNISCKNTTNNDYIKKINTLNFSESVQVYYPLQKGNNWIYSLEQFQDDKPNTKFKKMVMSVEKRENNVAIIKRFYPESTIQPNLTKAIILDDKIELSRYDLLENYMKSLINNFGVKSIDILKSPIKEGNSWEGRIFSGGTETITIENIETINVIAGKFDTIKVNHKIKYYNGIEDNLYYWYAKNVGTVKMYEEISVQLNTGKWIKMKSIGILEKYYLKVTNHLQ